MGVWLIYILLMSAHETVVKNRKAMAVGRREGGGAAVGMRHKARIAKLLNLQPESKTKNVLFRNGHCCDFITLSCADERQCKLYQYNHKISHLHTVS